MSVDSLVEYLLQQGIIQTKQEFQSRVLDKIKEMMRLIFETVKDKLDQRFGCFELFGFDILIDSELNPQLIEINTNPALFTDTSV